MFEQPDFLIRNNAELLALLRRYSPRGGMMIKKLQESWPNAREAIIELEKDGKVLVIRTGGNSEKEGHMKMVFWNEMADTPRIDTGKLPFGVCDGRAVLLAAAMSTRWKCATTTV